MSVSVFRGFAKIAGNGGLAGVFHPRFTKLSTDRLVAMFMWVYDVDLIISDRK
jgi:hypothetical protein